MTAAPPVYCDPDYQTRDPQLTYAEQEPASAGWDLAFGLTEAQVDQFVTADCGRRDVHNGHQGVGGTHA